MTEPVERRQRLSEAAEQAWAGLPPSTRQALRRTLGELPSGMGSWRQLIDETVDQARQVVGDRSTVAIVGPANAGKSTLYNLMIRRGQAKSPVSAIPGTTKTAIEADAGLFALVDTPGADAAGAVGEQERQMALAAAAAADVLVVVFDAGHGVRRPEAALFADLRSLTKPMVVCLNKIDLVPGRERAEAVGRAAGSLGLQAEQLLPISAKTGESVDHVLLQIASVEPGIVAALGRALPGYRSKLAQASIVRAATTAAAIAVTPLPIIDFLPLLAVQAAMVLSLARIYNVRMSLGRARELIATFGAGVLGRTLFYELSKFGGPPGWLVAAAVAVGTTAGLGYAAAVWFDQGTRLSADRVRRVGRAFSQTVIDRLQDLGRRRPERRTLRQRIEEVLDEGVADAGEPLAE